MTVGKTEEIRRFLLRSVRDHPRDLVRTAADHFAMSRQGIYRHVQKLVDDGFLVATGRTRARDYSLAVLTDERFALPLEGLEEDVVWRSHVYPLISGASENALRISQYGFTEMLNNAIVHSQGDKVLVTVTLTAISAAYVVWDNGIGIFKKIKEELHLEDERDSILQLAKGKLTTDPARHTGEGIFFTTRAFDSVAITAGELAFLHTRTGDWLIDDPEPTQGTFVTMQIDLFTERSLRQVFDRYTAGDDDFGFSRTHVPIFLAKYGDENLVSRSQAKRVVARLGKFKEAVLDFEGVSSVGQAFADEIFRVFRNENPDVHIVWVNANEEVTAMINRAVGARNEDQLRLM